MATNCYLKADPIKGESTDDKHTDWIEVESFSHGLSQPTSGSSSTGGRAAAAADFSPFTIFKNTDKASPDLNLYCATGKSIPKLEFEVCQDTGEKVCYLKLEFEDAIVQSIHSNGGGSQRATESVAFSYGKIAWTYTAVKNDGSAGDKVGPKKFNLETNKGE